MESCACASCACFVPNDPRPHGQCRGPGRSGPLPPPDVSRRGHHSDGMFRRELPWWSRSRWGHETCFLRFRRVRAFSEICLGERPPTDPIKGLPRTVEPDVSTRPSPKLTTQAAAGPGFRGGRYRRAPRDSRAAARSSSPSAAPEPGGHPVEQLFLLV